MLVTITNSTGINWNPFELKQLILCKVNEFYIGSKGVLLSHITNFYPKRIVIIFHIKRKEECMMILRVDYV